MNSLKASVTPNLKVRHQPRAAGAPTRHRDIVSTETRPLLPFPRWLSNQEATILQALRALSFSLPLNFCPFHYKDYLRVFSVLKPVYFKAFPAHDLVTSAGHEANLASSNF